MVSDLVEHRDRWGLLRNRRSIAVGREGITIRRWIGPARRLPWAECASFGWANARHAYIGTHGLPSYRLDDGIERLDELIAAMANWCADIGPADIERWLGPERTWHIASRSWERLDRMRTSGLGASVIQVAGLGVAAALLVLLMLAASDVVPIASVAYWLVLVPILTFAALMAWSLLMAALDGPWSRLTAVVTGPPWTVHVRHTGVEVERAGEPAQSFAWSEVREYRPWWGEVHLADGRVVALPECDELGRVCDVLIRVSYRRRLMHFGPRPSAETGLSPAKPPPDNADRGLSR